MKSRDSIRKLVVMALLSAMAFLVMVIGRIPMLSAGPLVLKYEPKDVIILIGGFIYGPVPAALMALVVAFIEMVTVSETAWIGFVMNVVSSCAFVCSASIIYKKNRTMRGAVIGLITSCITTTVVMLLYNYFLTPIFMGVPRAAVAGMLVPLFLPFNLIKSTINAAAVMMIYKPVTMALRKSKLLPESAQGEVRGKISLGAILLSTFIIITCIILVLVLQKKI